MAERWITYTKIVEVLNEHYNSSEDLKIEFKELKINKSKVQRFEKLLVEVFNYNLMDENLVAGDFKRKCLDYIDVFFSEERTGLLKKIKKEDEKQSLDYLNEYAVEACFNIFDIKNEYLENWTFLRDIETFFSFYDTSKEDSLIFLESAFELNKKVQEWNSKKLKKIRNNKKDFLDKLNKNEIEIRDDIEYDFPENINMKNMLFSEAVYFLLKLKIYRLTNVLMIKKQYVEYINFSKFPILNVDEIKSISNTVKLIYKSNIHGKAAKIRDIQRTHKRVYEYFEYLTKKIVGINGEIIENLKVYLTQLILLSEKYSEQGNIEANDFGEVENHYRKLMSETKKIIIKINNKDSGITHSEWEYILSYLIYKTHEYYLKEKTIDYMFERVEEELEFTIENYSELIRKIEKKLKLRRSELFLKVEEMINGINENAFLGFNKFLNK